MAQPWEQDWSKPTGSKPEDEAAPPWERKWGASHAAPPKAQDGQAVSGFKRSFQEVPGLLAGVGAFAADAVGADEARDSMLSYAKRKSDEVGAAHANDAQSLTDAWDGKVSWGDFLANAAGYVAGQALQSIATGGVGAIGAKMLASNGIKQIGVKVAAEQIAAGATEEVAKAAALKAMTDAGTKAAVRGGIAGATAQNLNMELGSIYPDAVEEAGGADKLDGRDRFRVLSAAALAAGVDTAGEALTALKWLKGSTAGGKTILARAAKEVPMGMAREAGTEAIQTGIEQWGAAKPYDLREIVDSAGIGAVGGGLAGGGASLRAREQEKKPEAKPGVADVLGAESVDDAINAATGAVSVPAGFNADAAMDRLDAQRQADEQGLRFFGKEPPRAPNAPAGVTAADVKVSEGEPIKEFGDRVLTVREQLADADTRERIRTALGAEALDNATYYATAADNTTTDIPQVTRDRMLGVAEAIVERALFKREARPGLGGDLPDAPGMLSGSFPLPRISLDTGPTGAFRVDAQGNAAPETNADAINTRQGAREAADARRARGDMGRQAPRGFNPNDAIRLPGAIPTGEASEVPFIPTGDATEVDAIPAGEASELLPTGDAYEQPARKLPVGKATELDVETIQPTDLMAKDGEPFTSKTGAQAKAYASGGGKVVAIPNHFGSGIPGYVVRPLMQARPNNTRGTDARDLPRSSNDDQRDLAGSAEQVPGASDGRGADAARSGGAVGLVPAAPGRVDQPAEAPSTGNRPADVVAGAGDADTALTPGSRVTLNGTPYTVTTVNGSAVKLQGADGGIKMVARNSKTFGQIQPEAATAPAEGPGSDAGNGFKQGPKAGERYRVGVVASVGGAVALEKRLPAGTAATFYIGKDGNLIDGDSVNLIGDGKDRLWIPATPEQAQQAQAILDEMGRLELNDPARKDAKARLKALVQGKPTQEPNEAARPQAQAAGAEGTAPAAAPAGAPAAEAVVPGAGPATNEAGRLTVPVRTFGSSGYQLTMAQALAKVKELEADARRRKTASTKAPTAIMRGIEEDAASRAATLARKLREDIKQAVNSYPDARAEYAEARGEAQPASVAVEADGVKPAWGLTREQYFNDPARVRREAVGPTAGGWKASYEYTEPSGATSGRTRDGSSTYSATTTPRLSRCLRM